MQRALAGSPRPFRVAGTASRLDALGSHLSHLEPDDVIETSHELLERVCGFDFHRGVLAVAHRAPRSFDDVVSGLGPTPVILVLERLADPANVGAAIRCARAFGVDMVLADTKGADPWGRRAVRACAGHVFGLPVVHSSDLPSVLSRIRAQGDCRVVAATLRDEARALRSTRRRGETEGLVLMLGNEGDGLSEELVSLCDEAVRIEMRDDVDSLNVAAASAVFLWALLGD